MKEVHKEIDEKYKALPKQKSQIRTILFAVFLMVLSLPTLVVFPLKEQLFFSITIGIAALIAEKAYTKIELLFQHMSFKEYVLNGKSRYFEKQVFLLNTSVLFVVLVSLFNEMVNQQNEYSNFTFFLLTMVSVLIATFLGAMVGIIYEIVGENLKNKYKNEKKEKEKIENAGKQPLTLLLSGDAFQEEIQTLNEKIRNFNKKGLFLHMNTTPVLASNVDHLQKALQAYNAIREEAEIFRDHHEGAIKEAFLHLEDQIEVAFTYYEEHLSRKIHYHLESIR